MKISFSSAFIRLFEKKIKNDKGLEEEFWRCTQLFIENPFDRRLKTRKLSGKLNEMNCGVLTQIIIPELYFILHLIILKRFLLILGIMMKYIKTI
jgi:mRNA-degrading endonuclease YafQ of YafQ-DinJ toxin-antitoxin module